MPWLLYIRLIGFTAGTLLMLFWMVVILGYRRQRNFERVFFFLCLSLFLFYGGSLLALNAQIYYAQLPLLLTTFAWTVLTVGLCFAPALLVHLHLEYADTKGLLRRSGTSLGRWKHLVLTLAYACVVYFVLRAYPKLATAQDFDFLVPATSLGRAYGIYLGGLLGVSAAWEFKFAGATSEREERRFHGFAGVILAAIALLAIVVHVVFLHLPAGRFADIGAVLMLLPIAPFGALIYAVEKHNFLQIGRQKNLMYAMSVTFLALLYLSLVRRVGTLLEPVLPPEATAAVLLFVLVIFIEPIQRALGRRLKETAQQEMDLVQRLTAEIQRQARQGDVDELARMIETRVKKTFELADAKVSFRDLRGISDDVKRLAKESGIEEPKLGESKFGLIVASGSGRQGHVLAGNLVGTMVVRPHGAAISGETRAALEFLCEQLPAALDLCRLIEEKLRLERELAERERMAALGQMAASISHNLKNPLGSIKTILQVQLENPELPDSIRGETRLVLEEIGRLSAKLNQLLQFSRPALAGERVNEGCDAATVTKEAAEVLAREAEHKGVALNIVLDGVMTPVRASKEAVSDIVSNLLVNALDATARGGRVAVHVERNGTGCLLTVEDDGPGIPQELREKILQPFFTTKTHGTGLGLAIVARRAAESGGKLDFESPTQDGHGARFSVFLPSVESKK